MLEVEMQSLLFFDDDRRSRERQGPSNEELMGRVRSQS